MLHDLAPETRLTLMKFVCSFAWADLEITDAEREYVARLVRLLVEHDEAPLTGLMLPLLKYQPPSAMQELYGLATRYKRHLPAEFLSAVEDAYRTGRSARRGPASWFSQILR